MGTLVMDSSFRWNDGSVGVGLVVSAQVHWKWIPASAGMTIWREKIFSHKVSDPANNPVITRIGHGVKE